MRRVVGQFPVLAVLAQMILEIEQVIQYQVPPERRPEFVQKLDWLRQVVNET